MIGFQKPPTPPPGFGLAARIRAETFLGDDETPATPVYLGGDSHIITFGPTGSGKSTLVAANALCYRGSMVILDLKGDIVQATARARREMGQEVHIIDPWNITGSAEKARLDPLDVTRLHREIEAAVETVAATLLGDFKAARDAYWYYSGHPFLTAVMLHVLDTTDPKELSINKVIDIICNNEDVVYSLAVDMDKNTIRKDSYQRGAIASFLALPDSNGSTRSCVLSTVQAGLGLLRSATIRSAMGPSTLDVTHIRDGADMTIYLCVPLLNLTSHAPVIRLWIETILQGLLARKRTARPPLYMMIDEAAQLGNCPALKTVSTFLRASGVRLHTFFQDLSQLKSLYPTDWQTILNNASTWTILKSTRLASQELAALTGIPLEAIRGIGADEQMVIEGDAEPTIVKTPRYWEHDFFAGRADPVERYLEPSSSPRR